MSKIINILKAGDGRIFVSIVLLLVAVMAFFFLSMAVSPENEGQRAMDPVAGIAKSAVMNNIKKTAVDPVKLEKDYKTSTAVAIRNFMDLDSSQKLNHEEVEKIKNELLALRVPTQYKDLHVDLVMAMVKMDIFFKDGKKENKLLCEKTIEEAKLKYSWLN